MATNFKLQECVIFVQSVKIGTHENKGIHSTSFSVSSSVSIFGNYTVLSKLLQTSYFLNTKL